ncbi:MAG: hypothetical protein HFF17_11790 [Oscillospiraceae bacterium]|nr:hypothetical protein [Oscillospiraceae bacterium]
MNTKRILCALLLCLALSALLAAGALAADETTATPEAFYAALERNLRAQSGEFSIEYTGSKAALGLPDDTALGSALRTMSARSPDGPDNADYPALNVAEGEMDFYDGAYHFEIGYLATPEELAEVSRRAADIVSSLSLAEEDDYARIKLLYEYIGTHYVYDDTLTKFSAYDGLTTGSMVCQGYALLTYRVMWLTGIPCRIVTGVSAMENHAWNIVQLDGKWYNLDATWDAADEIGGAMRWDYFLKSTEDFGGHTRFSPYETEAYLAAHPMAAESRTLPRVRITSHGESVANLVVRTGVDAQLEAVLEGGAAGLVEWRSGDDGLVQVSESGLVTARKLGAALLTASVPGNRAVIAAVVPTQTVDLRSASPWAFDTVTDYYLAQLLPVSLCGQLRQSITRGELARLCYQYVLKTQGWDAAVLENPFDDILESPDALPILRCASAGLMRGVSETEFAPDAPVTREQAAVVLMNLAAYLDGEDRRGPEHTAYPDADAISAWARSSVAAATEAGLLQGTDKGFQPKNSMTREQMVAALHRVYTARLTENAA